MSDCGNDCLGPEGHAEGCPVHCGCYDGPAAPDATARVWTREMAVELAREEYERGRAEMAEQLRSRWLDGREMSLRRMQHWLGSNPDATTTDVLKRVEQQLAAVESDRASRTRT